MSRLEVDDAQPAHAETHAWANVEAFVVGAAVREHVAHRLDFLGADRALAETSDARDAAHRT